MPLPRPVANAIIDSMQDTGWNLQTQLPSGDVDNPFRVRFHKDDQDLHLIIHARRLTPQKGPGTDHHRPPGEYHAQMIFDDDQRGAGIRNYLHFEDGALTLLLGYYLPHDEYVFAAYDPAYHKEYAYSKSLQVKDQTLETAERDGIAFQTRTTGEEIVAFPASNLPEYVEAFDTLHSLPHELLLKEYAGDDLDPAVLDALRTPETGEVQVPEMEPRKRREVMAEVKRRYRNYKFRDAIRTVYDCCAICGFQYGDVLDGAHIIPVSQPGSTDTYDNALGLCPRCHRMYDKGYILVDEQHNISLHPKYREKFVEQDQARSLSNLESELRETLWLPQNEAHRPSPDKLKQVYEERSR
jgi:putative restriction endonuclease